MITLLDNPLRFGGKTQPTLDGINQSKVSLGVPGMCAHKGLKSSGAGNRGGD